MIEKHFWLMGWETDHPESITPVPGKSQVASHSTVESRKSYGGCSVIGSLSGSATLELPFGGSHLGPPSFPVSLPQSYPHSFSHSLYSLVSSHPFTHRLPHCLLPSLAFPFPPSFMSSFLPALPPSLLHRAFITSLIASLVPSFLLLPCSFSRSLPPFLSFILPSFPSYPYLLSKFFLLSPISSFPYSLAQAFAPLFLLSLYLRLWKAPGPLLAVENENSKGFIYEQGLIFLSSEILE